MISLPVSFGRSSPSGPRGSVGIPGPEDASKVQGSQVLPEGQAEPCRATARAAFPLAFPDVGFWQKDL